MREFLKTTKNLHGENIQVYKTSITFEEDFTDHMFFFKSNILSP